MKENHPKFDSVHTLSNAAGFGERIVLESVAIHLDPHTVNREAGFQFSVFLNSILQLIDALIVCKLGSVSWEQV